MPLRQATHGTLALSPGKQIQSENSLALQMRKQEILEASKYRSKRKSFSSSGLPQWFGVSLLSVNANKQSTGWTEAKVKQYTKTAWHHPALQSQPFFFFFPPLNEPRHTCLLVTLRLYYKRVVYTHTKRDQINWQLYSDGREPCTVLQPTYTSKRSSPWSGCMKIRTNKSKPA